MEQNSYEAVKLKLKEIIVDELDANIMMEDIVDDLSLFEDGLGLDSITIVTFIVTIEKKFGLNFNENEMSTDTFSNINTLAHLICNKLEGVIK